LGGHIGYSIRKSERQKGYASEILGLALEKWTKLISFQNKLP
jgi:Predicted acetyltransferase